MALSTDLEILNRVLRELSSCFLQYAGECWPWTSAGAEGEKLRVSVMQCVERQRQSIGLLAEHLAAHQDRVEFGKFSSEFTDLHYVSLTFLLKRLVASQTKLVEFVDRTVTLLPNGDECREILEVVSSNERANLESLQAP